MIQDIAQLQAEIQCLNVIISVLVEKNQQLERDLSLARSDVGIPALSSVPSRQKMNLVQHESTLSKDLQGTEQLSGVLSSRLHGVKHEGNIELLFRQGIIQEGGILPLQNQRVEPTGTTPGSMIQRIEAPVSALSAMAIVILRQQLALSLTEDAIFQALKQKEMRKVSGNGVLRVARILLLLCSEDRVSYAAMRKQVHMTDSGINKLVASLKRRDLVRRAGFQQYALTNKAFELLKQANTHSRSTLSS